MKNILIAFGLFGCLNLYSQYTDELNTSRPGISRTAYSVGKNVFQGEQSLYFEKQPNHTFAESRIGIETGLHYGFLTERLEANLLARFQIDSFTENYSLSYPDAPKMALRNLTAGFKYLIFEPPEREQIRRYMEFKPSPWEKFIPSVAVFAGVNTDFVSERYKSKGISPLLKLIFQNGLSDRTVWLNTFIFDEIINKLTRNYTWASAITQALTDNLSFIYEMNYQRGNHPSSLGFGIGGAYLLGTEMQVDVFGNYQFQNTAPVLALNIGFSWRIDGHSDYKPSGEMPDGVEEGEEGPNPLLDELGEPVFDEEGNPVFEDPLQNEELDEFRLTEEDMFDENGLPVPEKELKKKRKKLSKLRKKQKKSEKKGVKREEKARKKAQKELLKQQGN